MTKQGRRDLATAIRTGGKIAKTVGADKRAMELIKRKAGGTAAGRRYMQAQARYKKVPKGIRRIVGAAVNTGGKIALKRLER